MFIRTAACSRRLILAVLIVMVPAALAASAAPSVAGHGGDHFKRSFFTDVHLATPAIAPIAHVCVDDDGDPATPATCTPSSVPSMALTDFRVAVDLTARSAAPPEAEQTECPPTSPRGGGLRAEAFGTGIDNAVVTVTDLQSGEVVFRQETGKVLGNRVTVTGSLCSE